MKIFINKINFHLNAFLQAFLVTIKGWQHFYLYDNIPTESIIKFSLNLTYHQIIT